MARWVRFAGDDLLKLAAEVQVSEQFQVSTHEWTDKKAVWLVKTGGCTS